MVGNKTNDEKLNFISVFIISLMIITAAIPREITLLSFADGANREYGSAITLSLTWILFFLLLFFQRKITIKNQLINQPLAQYLVFGLLIGIFGAIIQENLIYYLIGGYKYFFYFILFVIIASNINYSTISKGIEYGLTCGCLLQSFIGILRVYTGTLIPFLTGTSEYRRNGMLRLVGTFQHPGDCSLYLSICLSYFLCHVFFSRQKRFFYIAMSILCFFTIYLTQARTILIIAAIAISIVLLIKYRKHFFMKVFFLIAAICAIPYFFNSDIYYELFIRNSFTEMMYARMVHWIAASKIMAESIFNFIFGVGLNNVVDYLDENYLKYADLFSASTILDEAFVRGMPIHNSFLIVGCELGIFGLIMYVRCFIKELIWLVKECRLSTLYKKECMFALTALISFMIYCLQGWAAHKNFAWVLLIFLFVYIHLLKKEIAKAKENTFER